MSFRASKWPQKFRTQKAIKTIKLKNNYFEPCGQVGGQRCPPKSLILSTTHLDLNVYWLRSNTHTLHCLECIFLQLTMYFFRSFLFSTTFNLQSLLQCLISLLHFQLLLVDWTKDLEIILDLDLPPENIHLPLSTDQPLNVNISLFNPSMFFCLISPDNSDPTKLSILNVVVLLPIAMTKLSQESSNEYTYSCISHTGWFWCWHATIYQDVECI